MNPFNPFMNFFKPTNLRDVQRQNQDMDDIDVRKTNIFQNNALYFQKCQDLESRVDYLQKINEFLISQVLQTFGNSKYRSMDRGGSKEPLKKNVDVVRKKSLKFEDDKCLNRTFQLFKIFKGLLDSGKESLQKISKNFYPPSFDFESQLYNKNYQSIINVVLKSAIHAIIWMKEELNRTKVQQMPLPPQAGELVNPKINDTSLILKMDRDIGRDMMSFNSGGSVIGKRWLTKELKIITIENINILLVANNI